MKTWRFLPHPVAALYQNSFLIRRALYTAIDPIVADFKGSVLDFGCGSKPYRTHFRRCDEYIGVDIAVSGHDHADSHVDIYYDGRTLPFDEGRFDGAVAFEVFEHVFNIDEMLAELRRVLRHNGDLLITLPFAWPEHEVPYDFARYTGFGIRAVMERNGYAIVSITKTNGTVEAIHQLWLQYVSVRIFDRLGIVGKLIRVPIAACINGSAMILRHVLPKDDTFYSNLVVHAQRHD